MSASKLNIKDSWTFRQLFNTIWYTFNSGEHKMQSVANKTVWWESNNVNVREAFKLHKIFRVPCGLYFQLSLFAWRVLDNSPSVLVTLRWTKAVQYNHAGVMVTVTLFVRWSSQPAGFGESRFPRVLWFTLSHCCYPRRPVLGGGVTLTACHSSAASGV